MEKKKFKKSNLIWIIPLIFGIRSLISLFIIQPYYTNQNKNLESNYETIKGHWVTVDKFLNQDNNQLEKCNLHIGTFGSNSVSYTPPNQKNVKFSKEGKIVDILGNNFIVGSYNFDGTYNTFFILTIEEFDLNSNVNTITVNNYIYERIN